MIINLDQLLDVFHQTFIYSEDGHWCPRCGPEVFLSSSYLSLTSNSLLSHQQICTETEPLALIVINSAPSHYLRRKQIRQTYLPFLKVHNIIIKFALGTLYEGQTCNELKKEQEMYQDLIQWGFKDSWRNLTLKTIATLNYHAFHCPTAKYLIKADDDTVIHPQNLVSLLNRNLSFSIVSHLLYFKKVCSNWWSLQFCIPKKYHYKINNLEYFPPYPAGGLYIITRDAISPLISHINSLSDKFFLEDAFIGMVANATQVNLIDDKRFMFSNVLKEEDLDEKTKNAIAIFDCSALQFQKLWSIISNYLT